MLAVIAVALFLILCALIPRDDDDNMPPFA